MKLIRFTIAHNNKPCFINPEYVQYVTEATGSDGTAIWCGDLSPYKNQDSIVPLIVSETLGLVIKRLRS